MINVVITGLYNRGQQDEYIELEAAGRCSLDGLMVLRYLNNPEGFRFMLKHGYLISRKRMCAKVIGFVFIRVIPR